VAGEFRDGPKLWRAWMFDAIGFTISTVMIEKALTNGLGTVKPSFQQRVG
jgi:hypothetical protein